MLVMSRKDEIYKPALAGKKIPILTLDNKWHKLFTQKKPDKKLRRLEEELIELLKHFRSKHGVITLRQPSLVAQNRVSHYYCSPPTLL